MKQADIKTEIEGEIFRPKDGQTDRLKHRYIRRDRQLTRSNTFCCFGKHSRLRSK
jgi:hypothetical protein